jgi:hypothetical protein
VNEFLVLGYAPSDGAPVRMTRRDERIIMLDQLGADRYGLLRRSIIEMRPHAKELVARAGANAVMVQHPPPAVGGPMIEVHLLDAVTSNPLWRQIAKEQILDVIDHTIGAIKSGMLRLVAQRRQTSPPRSW